MASASDQLRRALDAHVSGATGVPFEVMAWFAEPLFELYQADPRVLFDGDRLDRDADEAALQLAVLESARLLLAYLLLEQDEARYYLPELESRMLGREATETEQSDFQELIALLEDRWADMPGRFHPLVEGVRNELPPFYELLEGYAPEPKPETPPTGAYRFGPDNLDLPEAMALFARPLLETAEVLSDPDLLEDRLARAHAYWDLALAPRDEYEASLNAAVRTFGHSPTEREAVRLEAERMVDRFYTLFPEQRRRKS